MRRNGTSRYFRLFSAVGLLALACSTALAESPPRQVLYYCYVPGVGSIPVYRAASARTPRTAAAPAGADPTYGSQAPQAGESDYYERDYPGAPVEKPDQKRPARIRVRLPADATLLINGQKTTATGAVREFETPELDPDQVYTYLLLARWTEGRIMVEKRLRVRTLSGTRVTVNFVLPVRERPRPVAPVTESTGPLHVVPPASPWTAPSP